MLTKKPTCGLLSDVDSTDTNTDFNEKARCKDLCKDD